MLHRDPEWTLPPQVYRLSPDLVHVWLADLQDAAAYCSLRASILSSDEQGRAGRFRFERDRRWYIAAHVVLRLVLSRYLKQAPERLTFCCGRYGKPSIAASSRPLTPTSPLRFNLSYSGGMAVYAVALESEVGVDIERMRTLREREHLAATVFSKREQEAMLSLPERDRDRAFYTCWSRKEALIKAAGYGLHMPLDHFDVSLEPGEPARLRDIQSLPEMPMDAARWSLCDLPNIPGYSGALAIERRNFTLICWSWNQKQPQRVPG
jgi:4'-phosphopantetheinyl transferase